MKKRLIPAQYKVKIEFNEGELCNMRVSKNVGGFDTQEENVNGFIECLKRNEVDGIDT